MSIAEVVVAVPGAALTAGLWRFFFGAKEASRSELRDGVQEVTVTVKGGYCRDTFTADPDHYVNELARS